MKKANIKTRYLTSFVLTILVLISFVQITDNAGTVRAASANQVLKASSMELPREKLNLVAFSPDGKTLANAGSDGQIILWDVVTGQARVTLPSQFKILVNGIVFSPDGNTLASLTDDTIRLWDVKSGDVRLTLPDSVLVTDLVFSPDGKTLAAVSLDARITLWDSQSGSTNQIPTGHQSGVNVVVFSPDSTILATGGQDAQIKLWDMKTGLEQASLPGEVGVAVTDLVFSPDGKTLAAVGQDARVTLWDSQSGSTTQVLNGHQSGVNVIAFSPNSKILATGGQDAQIRLWDMKTGLEQASLQGEGGAAVTGLVFSPNGKSLATVGESETVFLWDVSNKLPQLLTGHSDWVDKVIFSSNQKTLASVGKAGEVVVWNLATGLEQQTFQIPTLLSASLAGSQAPISGSAVANISSQLKASNTPIVAKNTSKPDGNSQVASKDNTGKSKKRSAQNWKGVKAIAMSQDGMEMGAAGEDGSIRVFKKNGSQRWKVAGHHGMGVTGLAFRGKTKEWVSVGKDTEIKTWDGNGKNLQTFYGPEQPPRAVAVSPDGRFIATAGEDTRVFLFDAETDKLSTIFSGHKDFVNGLAFSPNGQILASAGAEGSTILWDVKTGKQLWRLLGHSDEVNAVAFSPDGTLLASASQDSTVILWGVMTGQQIKTLTGHQGSVRSVAFNPNGKELVSAGEDSKMLVWDPATGLLKKQLNGPPVAINALTFGPDGNLHVASENSEVSEFNTDTDTKVETIVVPVSSTLDPQASRSEALTLASKPNLDLLTSSRFVHNSNIESMKQSDTALYSIFNHLLDWVIPSAEAALPSNQGPGGPILVVTTSSDHFGEYYAEILRTEGLNNFAVTDISTVSAPLLANYDVVIVARMTLTSAQVTMFTDWVTSGGNLIAMRPDGQLAGLLGLNSAGLAPLANGYLLVDTSRAPGNGIVNQTIQYHDQADLYTLNGASSLALLYSNASTATTYPALTLRSVGSNGGHAAAFTYDLAKSIVYTRQGNPAWAAQERDGFTPIRSDDKFYGNASGDVQPDWVDLNKVAIPQADEQQRLLANLILQMNLAKKPLPRFWYFPNSKIPVTITKAVVIMTGDDHGNGGTTGRFNQFISRSPAGCVVDNWECVRGTSYMYTSTPVTNAQAAAFNTQGFEVGLHVNTNCADFTPASLDTFYSQQISDWTGKYTSIPAPITQRHHCIAWSDWVSGATVQLNHGIRLDTSYYYWPPGWVNDTPGLFTGSVMPMRFSDLSGNMIDVYQAASQMTDESGQTYPFTIDTLLDRALGAEGHYGAFTINAHTDLATEQASDAVLDSAIPRGVPIVSAVQMLRWLDGRNNSSFGSPTWNGSSLSFTVTTPAAGANGLQAMVPTHSLTGVLTGVTGPSGVVPYIIQNIKGIEYAFFAAVAGSYTAVYSADTTPPTVISTVPTAGATGVSTITTVTATFSEAMNPATITTGAFELRDAANTLVPATVNYNATTLTATLTPSSPLAASTTYTATVKGGAVDPRVKDLAGNALAANFTWSFTTGTGTGLCTNNCTIWTSATVPGTTVPGSVDSGPDSAVELGVKFKADVAGTITGIRFYKAGTNTGTHVGNLWTSTGTKLASATFSGETASGWQQVLFSTPVAITANTIYVASYHANAGHYSTSQNGFATGVDNPPLHALANGVSGGNGVYAYGSTSAFPSQTFNSTNYWVDAVFSAAGPPPALTSIAVTPTTPTILTGATQPFTATGTYSDSSTQNLSNQVTWVSSTTAVATINTVGLASSVNSGSTTISATSGSVSGNTTLTVNAAPLNITTTSLPNGTLNVAYPSTTLAASGGTPPYTSWSISSGALPAGLSLNPSTGAITGTPTAAGTFSFTAQVRDSASPVVTATKALSITVAAAATSIWPSTTVPSLVDGGPDSAVELGVKFKSDVSGTITGIRFYKASTNTGTHVGNLWTSTGTLLASATFSSETASGWQQVLFSSPVAITANTVYVASYHANAGHYSADLNYFASTGVDNPPLHALANGVSGADGVYVYGATSAFPTLTWNSANYWVDVTFNPSGAVSLNVTTTSLPGGAVSVPYSATLAASGGTTPYIWSITNGSLPTGLNLTSTGAISGTPTATGTFNFTAQVSDSATPVGTATKALSITVAAAATSIWPSTAVPGLVDGGPDSAVELGVKFKSDVSGHITGIRFYKASTNTGTHVGNLWTSTGTLLASATFSGETASGWQQVNFTTPVAITTNTVYVASYHSNAGHYSADLNYFASTGVDSPPLHALANGVSGGDGVYAYGSTSAFPTLTWNNANYWVDVVFTTP